MSVMSNQSFSMSGVKEAGTNSVEGLSPGRCPTERQGGPGRHRTTAKGGRRRKWSQVNRIVMRMLLQQQPRSSEIYRENSYDLERKRNV